MLKHEDIFKEGITFRDWDKEPLTQRELADVQARIKKIHEQIAEKKRQQRWTPEKWARMHRPMDI